MVLVLQAYFYITGLHCLDLVMKMRPEMVAWSFQYRLVGGYRELGMRDGRKGTRLSYGGHRGKDLLS